MNKSLIVVLLVIAFGSGAAGAGRAQSETDSRQIAVADYTLFVDPPTGFVFVKLPQGWKFAGKIEPTDVARLPANVVTTLLRPDREVTEADSSAQQAARGAQDPAGWQD